MKNDLKDLRNNNAKEFGDIGKKAKKASKIASIFVVGASAIALLSSLAVSPLWQTSDLKAELLSLSATETSVSFEVRFDDLIGHEVKISLENDFTYMEREAQSLTVSATWNGLKDWMTYEFKVKDKGIIVLEKEITTKRSEK